MRYLILYDVWSLTVGGGFQSVSLVLSCDADQTVGIGPFQILSRAKKGSRFADFSSFDEFA